MSMQLTGLSNQWKDRLVQVFEPDPSGSERCQERYRGIQRLFQHLATIDGPDLWVGSSLSSLGFCARDIDVRTQVMDEKGRLLSRETIPALAHVDTSPLGDYAISYPLPIEYSLGSGHWDTTHTRGYARNVDQAGRMLLEAIACSGANPDRPSSKVPWYVCPKCDFHTPHYCAECLRCGFLFPSEHKCQVRGLYRFPKTPAGAAYLMKSGQRWKPSADLYNNGPAAELT